MEYLIPWNLMGYCQRWFLRHNECSSETRPVCGQTAQQRNWNTQTWAETKVYPYTAEVKHEGCVILKCKRQKWRFPKSLGHLQNHPKLDHFSIQTYGLGDPPFRKTCMYIYILIGGMKVFGFKPPHDEFSSLKTLVGVTTHGPFRFRFFAVEQLRIIGPDRFGVNVCRGRQKTLSTTLH